MIILPSVRMRSRGLVIGVMHEVAGWICPFIHTYVCSVYVCATVATYVRTKQEMPIYIQTQLLTGCWRQIAAGAKSACVHVDRL